MKIEKYAAIDIGSNAVRMLIANVIQTDARVYYKKNALVRLPVRLGQDAFTSGRITPSNIEKLVKALQSFQLLMEVHQVRDYLAFATSALREAVNRDEIVALIAQKTAINVEIIDGKREAKVLANLKVVDWIETKKNFLYVDVGGGSTELSILENGRRKASKSFKIGTVRLLNHMVEPHVWKDFENWIKTHTADYEKIYLLGTGGNINKLFKLANLKEGDPISLLSLNAIYKKLSAMSYESRIVELGLNPDRSDVILPATEIYLRAMHWSQAKRIYVPKIGLTDGMIREMFKNNKVGA